MAFFDGKEPFNIAGSERMASKGKAVFCEVHFTNSTEEAFPRGFNDCVAAIRWFHERQEKFNLIRGAGVMVTGESGGANLTAATCLKLKGEGIIACAVLGCPYLKPPTGLKDFGKYTEDEINALYLCHPKEAWTEPVSKAMISLYTNSEEGRKNVLAWPGFATDEDVKGLPPTLFLMDEGDALTAQGLEYYRKLDRNGVTASAVTFAGSSHGMYAFDPLHTEIAESYYVALTRTHCKPKEAAQEEKETETEQ
jgi:acetyl esterase/lipase